MTSETILVPDLGGADTVDVIELCVAVGDTVALEQSLIVLESDKATMDVPSPQAGQVKKLLVKEGDKVSEGSPILEIEKTADETDSAEESAASRERDDAPQPEDKDETPESAEEEDSESEAAEKPDNQAEPSEAKSPAVEEDVLVPDIGGTDAVEVIEVMADSGDQLAEGDGILVVETDKASMELPAPFAGELISVAVKVGDKIATGDKIARMKIMPDSDQPGTTDKTAEPDKKTGADSASSPSEKKVGSESDSSETDISSSGKKPDVAEAPVASEEPSKPDAASTIEDVAAAEVYAGPASRALARELGVDLRKVSGSGPRNRILKEDLHEYVKNAVAKSENAAVSGATGAGIPPIPTVDFARFGEIEMVPLQKIHKLTAANMQRSWLNVPHVTQFDEADITELEAFRHALKAEAEKRNSRLTLLPFLLKACGHALAVNTSFNRSLASDGEHFVEKKYIHIGVAVDTPRGLVVPVIRDVDRKGLWELTDEVNEMAVKAREGKLSAAEMQGGCFTISSLGAIGGNGFTPIVNAPEAAILGVSKSQIKPVWDGAEFQPKLMLPLSVSYDHRIVNGADCGRFFTCLVDVIADIRRLLL
ncbi:dihydrolipoyllysine-residue acetyltransferase [Porticoccus sp.]|uniref:dihydrolipoyllysine-residue acetyltransferase n=1 Tax=Porticoccus sp. TaxID=2024853 RepID=UPI000C655472|nr:dihydrolipoyllysine-residue acetyltransferase [Porticoccus sp.]MAZ69166.1 dihydrolipoyllysine-residue acetyltransferase [Porticoccus sp.]